MSVKVIPISKKYRANYDRIFDKTYWHSEIGRKQADKQIKRRKMQSGS